MLKKLVACLCLAFAVAAAPASAQTTYSKTRIVYEFSESVFAPILKEIEATYTLSRTTEGGPMLNITYKNGVKAFLYFRACTDGKKCLGTVLIASFDGPEGKTATEIEEINRQFNDSHPPAKVYGVSSGSQFLQAYMIADDGVTMGNLRVQVSLFGNLAATYSEALYDD